ncbi:MAG TPA: tRNA (adenosine(37)-N6)-dimethylallyltransferase MiaA [Polyangia bacterium]|nr:tRNA (adenosine(37)-N6)-dimethylallyltransferase MiaA [Polyangia bacterium]
MRFLALLGPTASGKSALALAVAERTPAEIVACDSQQVYVGMEIGTAKPTPDERRRISHHGLDLCRPDQTFHAARWAEIARAAIHAIAARGRLPIVVGGTGLYYRALTAGLFEAPPPDPTLRARHRALADSDGIEALRARLLAVDPESAAAIGPRDLVRISRALEVYEQTGQTIGALRRQAATPRDLDPVAVLLDPPLDLLRARIAARVQSMLAAGFLDEVRALRQDGYGTGSRPMQALGYQQLAAVLDGVMTVDAAAAEIARVTLAYARRQRTWFKKESIAARFPEPPPPETVLQLLAGAPSVPPPPAQPEARE